MSDINIWEKLDLSKDNLVTAYDLLIPQADNFEEASMNILEMKIDVTRSKLGRGEPIIIYLLYVQAPKLGGYKQALIRIIERPDKGRFPVDIFNLINPAQMYKNVDEGEFLEKIKEVLENKLVQVSIENLYRQSIEADKN